MVAVFECECFCSLGVVFSQHYSHVVCLTPGIRKKNCIVLLPQTLAQHFRIFSLVLVHVDGCGMNQLGSLVLDNLRDSRMAVPHIHRRYSRYHVQVPFSKMIPQILCPSLHHKQGFLVIMSIKIVHVFASVSDHLLVGWARVGLWLIIVIRKLWYAQDSCICFSNHENRKLVAENYLL